MREQEAIGGFETFKAVESLIESYLQVLVVFVMLCQISFEGVLNQSIFAFESEDDEIILGIVKLPAKYIFCLSSGISFMFIVLEYWVVRGSSAR